MHSYLRVASFVLLISFFVGLTASAQNPPGMPQQGPPQGIQTGPPKTASLTVQVFTDDGNVLQTEALVTVRSVFSGMSYWGMIRHQAEANFDRLDPGLYDIEVTAAGYSRVVQRFEVSIVGDRVTVVLKRTGALPALDTPTITNVPKAARKETARGVEALMAGQFAESERRLRKASKQAPGNADVNYLLGVLYFEKKDLAEAKAYLQKAVDADPKHTRALTALGRVLVQLKDASAAVPYLERSVSLDPDQWTAHSLLANAYVIQGQYDKAELQAREALRTGKGAATASRIPLGQALARLGRIADAIQEFETFLREVPTSPLAGDVQRMLSQLKRAVAEGGPSTPVNVEEAPALPLLAPLRSDLVVPSWAPPSVDEVRPPTSAAVSCPDAQVIDGAAAQLRELVTSLGRFDAKEAIAQEEVDQVGTRLQRQSGSFSYVAEISEPAGGIPRVTEYRAARDELVHFGNDIETSGLPALVFVFHPSHRDNFVLTCEGLGQWNGQPTWLVYFRQREDRPSRLMGYRPDPNLPSSPVDLKGRAWIAADNYRVLHIEAESIHPVPAVQLLSQKVIVDYGPVVFPEKQVELWLPKKAELYFHFGGHRYHRTHTFDDFKLFSVDATQKVVTPK